MSGDIDRKRRGPLWVLCCGFMLASLDSTIVNVALPSISRDMRFEDTALVWVVNAYVLTYGGFLLLAGRLGDLFGPRRLFLIGVLIFTSSSVMCGLADSRVLLIAGRALQGLGGAIVTAIVLSMIVRLFPDLRERTRALAIYGFVSFGGATAGVLAGGVLATAIGWRWIFLVNLPIGIAVFICGVLLLPGNQTTRADTRVDVAGAALITVSLMLVLGVLWTGHDMGWHSSGVLALGGSAVLLFAAFFVVEQRTRLPLIPLRLFRHRNFLIACTATVLWAGAVRTWMLVPALYLQGVLGYSPMDIALVFLPANLIVAASCLWISDKLVLRFGTRVPMCTGMLLGALGLAMLVSVPTTDAGLSHFLPGILLFGLALGIVFNPLMSAAMSDVGADTSGVASGILNTTALMGGAIGLAVVVNAAAARTQQVLAGSSKAAHEAVAAGYQHAFLVGSFGALIAALLALIFIRSSPVVGRISLPGATNKD